jgi:hypothetical protein
VTAAEYFRLGVELAEKDRLGDAFVALEECVTLDPDHGQACKLLAKLSLAANEVRAFTNWLHEAQRIDERDPEPHLLLAEHLAGRRRWEEAAAEVRIARRKDPHGTLAARLDAVSAKIPADA